MRTCVLICCSIAIFCGAVVSSEVVYGDELMATRGQPLVEAGHSVTIRLKDGVAHYRVRRTFVNRGSVHEQAILRIQLPPGAAVTGLRIRAQGQWHDGELMEANKARALYEKLTGIGPHAPKDPALMQWLWEDHVQLNLFPVVPGLPSLVEYSLTVPTTYARGHYQMYYPARDPASKLAQPVFHLSATSPASLVRIANQIVSQGQSVVVPLRENTDPDLQALESHGSHIKSEIAVAQKSVVRGITIDLDVRHTYRGDLRVVLKTPWGHRHTLHQNKGGNANDLRRQYQVPVRGRHSAAGTWKLFVSDMQGRDVGTLQQWMLSVRTTKGTVAKTAGDTPIAIPDAPRSDGINNMHQIVIGAAPRAPTHARLGRVPIVPSHQFSRLEVDVAPQLGQLPSDLMVVFVIDLSRSLPDGGVDAQLEVARGYLTRVPAATFQLVGFHRTAMLLTPKAVPAALFDKTVAKLQKQGRLRRRNGSELGRAVETATKLLSGSGTKRLILLTDSLMRPSWRNREALAALPKRRSMAITHLVHAKSQGIPAIQRTDANPLAAIPKVTGGMAVAIPGANADQRKLLEEVALGLVRPVQIDNVSITGHTKLELPEVLREGSGVREMIAGAWSPKIVELRGDIWGRPYRKKIVAKASFSRHTAAWVFPLGRYYDLSDAQQLRIAMFGRAVSPVTAYLAIEPGVRPSTAGLPKLGRGGFGVGAGGATLGRIGNSPSVLDWANLLNHGIASCKQKHPVPAPWRVVLDIHLTHGEVVDVIVAKPSPLARCVAEQVWVLEINHRDQIPRESYQLIVLPNTFQVQLQ